jgi:hypothetical protein
MGDTISKAWPPFLQNVVKRPSPNCSCHFTTAQNREEHNPVESGNMMLQQLPDCCLVLQPVTIWAKVSRGCAHLASPEGKPNSKRANDKPCPSRESTPILTAPRNTIPSVGKYQLFSRIITIAGYAAPALESTDKTSKPRRCDSDSDFSHGRHSQGPNESALNPSRHGATAGSLGTSGQTNRGATKRRSAKHTAAS